MYFKKCHLQTENTVLKCAWNKYTWTYVESGASPAPPLLVSQATHLLGTSRVPSWAPGPVTDSTSLPCSSSHQGLPSHRSFLPKLPSASRPSPVRGPSLEAPGPGGLRPLLPARLLGALQATPPGPSLGSPPHKILGGGWPAAPGTCRPGSPDLPPHPT